MAWLKKANAEVIHKGFRPENWSNFLDHNASALDQRMKLASTKESLAHRASEILGEDLSLDRFLLTHCTIVASVDTREVQNVKLGSVVENGRTINRLWNNFRITTESLGFINNNCFVPGTLVTMSDGTMRPIEEVQVGDFVITHLGRSRRVLRVFEKEIDEEILELKPHGTTDRIRCTKDHPFYVFRQPTCPGCGKLTHWNHKYNYRCTTHLLGKVFCSRSCRKECGSEIPTRDAEFVEAGELNRFDIFTSPVVTETREVSLTEGQARLIGYFLAEGYYELDKQSPSDPEWFKRGVCFAFNETETDTLAANVQNLLKSEFGAESVIRTHSWDKGIHVTSRTNRELVDFFSHWVRGSGSKTKYLHEDLLYAPSNIQKEILRGWFEGDGCLHQNILPNKDIRLSGASSSRSLINQVQMILFRLGLSGYVTIAVSPGRKRVVSFLDGHKSVKIINDDSKQTVAWQLTLGAGWISDLIKGTVYEKDVESFLSQRKLQKASKFRFFNGNHCQLLDSSEPISYKGKIYNIEVEEDHSYLVNGVSTHNCDSFPREVLLESYPTFIGAQNFREHLQLMEHSKGRIIDAVARDIGPSVYVDILIATDRKHTDLVREIEDGTMGTLSMGCSVTHCQCTKCGNVSEDETTLCDCQKYERGNTFVDELGNIQKVAELCGNKDLDHPTKGVKFIEASWVKVPAFQGAVLRNLVKPEVLTVNTKKKARKILSQKSSKWEADPNAFLKAAKMVKGFDFGDMGGDEGGGEDSGEEEKKEPEKTPIEDLEDETENFILDNVRDRIQKKIRTKNQEDAVKGGELSTSSNDNVQKTASRYRRDVEVLYKVARSDTDLMNSVAVINSDYGIVIDRDLYRTALEAGSMKKASTYLHKCEKILGRKLRGKEAQNLIVLGDILSGFQKPRT